MYLYLGIHKHNSNRWDRCVCTLECAGEKKKRAVHSFSQQYKIWWLSLSLYDLHYQVHISTPHSKTDILRQKNIHYRLSLSTIPLWSWLSAGPKGREPLLQAASSIQWNSQNQSHSSEFTHSLPSISTSFELHPFLLLESSNSVGSLQFLRCHQPLLH